MKKSIILIGSENTGKTELCKAMADHFKIPFNPEYARQYCIENPGDLIFDDVMPIAKGQIESELEFRKNHQGDFLLFDTCLFSTICFSEIYYRKVPDAIWDYFDEHQYDHFLLCHPDIPWKEDGIRKKPFPRSQMHEFFEKKLKEYEFEYQEIKGRGDLRLKMALNCINNVLK